MFPQTPPVAVLLCTLQTEKFVLATLPNIEWQLIAKKRTFGWNSIGKLHQWSDLSLEKKERKRKRKRGSSEGMRHRHPSMSETTQMRIFKLYIVNKWNEERREWKSTRQWFHIIPFSYFLPFPFLCTARWLQEKTFRSMCSEFLVKERYTFDAPVWKESVIRDM